MSGAAKSSTAGSVLLRLAIGATLGFGIAAGADPHTQFLRVADSEVPPGALRMTLAVLVLGALFFAGGLLAARRRRFASSAPTTVAGRPKLRRAQRRAGFRALWWQVMLSGWLALAYPEQWTWPTVGLKTGVSLAVSAIVGMLAYGALVAILTGVIHVCGDPGRFLDGSVSTMAALVPRGRTQKAMTWIAFCLFNPVIEELLFRGVLVYQTSLVLGSPWLPIAVGLLVNIGNHWYQGWRSMLLHVPFFAVAVALLFSPLGLAGAVGFHVAGDVVPMALVRRQLRQFRERHRRVGSQEKGLAVPSP